MRRYGHIVYVAIIILSGLWTARAAWGHGKQTFLQVAHIVRGSGTRGAFHLAAYDTDHDGFEELLLYGNGTVWLYEHMGDNQYEPVLQLPDHGPWAASDIDQDGLSDIVVQGFDSLEVFESPSPDTYPTQCVWQWEILSPGQACPTWITDLDQDGRREMFVIQTGSFIDILENRGDNIYEHVFRDSLWLIPLGPILRISDGDFDLDGKTEFVTSDVWGRVIMYENTAVGVDSFAITWINSLPLWDAYENDAANDMDRDGKPEFIVAGDHDFGGGDRFIFTLFETAGDDLYEPVWADSSLTGSVFARSHAAFGDVDGDSIDEMVLGLHWYGIHIFKCNGPDSYERIWAWYTNQRIGDIFIYDLNRNGYGEIVVSAENGTWIFEKELPGVNEMPDARYQMPACPERSRGEARLMQNEPNPFRGETVIRYHLAAPAPVSLRIYDRAGQLVKTLVDGVQQAGFKSAVWDGRDDWGGPVPSGIYFYRLNTGQFTSTRSLVILK